ncbi:MAG: amidase [Polyangia bacterium]
MTDRRSGGHEREGTPLTDLGLTELLTRLQARRLSSRELVEAHIARIEQVNPAINALVAERFAAARAEAEAADARYAAAAAAGEDPRSLPPLLGVPCSIKEFVAVAGMPLSAGCTARRGQRASADATVTARLKAAGAIVLGVTNVPEGGLWMETYNHIYGRTNNPFDIEHTPGGSSGGEAALLAAGGSVFGIGSDVGGSIRIPSAFCGVVGHKPSAGLVPNTGHFPPAPPPGADYLATGPLCRRVADVLPVLRVIAGPDGQDAAAGPLVLGDPASVRLDELTVYPLHAAGRVRASRRLQQAVDDATAAVTGTGEHGGPGGHGARRGELAVDLSRRFELWTAAMTSAHPQGYGPILTDGGQLPLWRELLRLPFGRSSFILPSLVMVLGERVVRRLGLQDGHHLARIPTLRAELDAALGDRGVIIHPPYSRTAPRHGSALLTPFDFGFTSLWNILGYPVTVVPLGFDDQGLPVSVQVIARHGQDHLTLAVAAAIERRFGGWQRAEPSPPQRRQRPATLVHGLA